MITFRCATCGEWLTLEEQQCHLLLLSKAIQDGFPGRFVPMCGECYDDDTPDPPIAERDLAE